ncbi:alpha/beta fold hydrolase [Rhabdothermincola sediminis]|uniref:alpha/beta fold hydrolase n=1 Tax=Rhabdothermincola sediminis TaxID=2751370 RepID=UPI001AA06CC5|nr:alpha/beta hydrolase [Rhabdothermincola sediminis]
MGRTLDAVAQPSPHEPLPAPSDAPAPAVAAVPRLARHTFTLADGHKVGLAVAGRGVPLVVVHGYTAEGFLYAQTLHRLVRKGFKVIAIDMAGHGGTQGLPGGGARLGDYARLMGRCIDELGIRKAVTAGHSMGGRVVAQLAALEPDRTIATLLIDAIVGDQWDWMVRFFRLAPPLLAMEGAALLVDTLATVPLATDPGQARKLGRLLTPTLVGHALQPWRLIGPAASILRTRGSAGLLDALAANEVPTFVIHGELDLVVPVCTARSAATRANGQLVTVKRAAHSWLLRDPETLPAIVSQLLEGRLGEAIRSHLQTAGAETVEELEELLYAPDAPILALTPDHTYSSETALHRPPKYEWTIH